MATHDLRILAARTQKAIAQRVVDDAPDMDALARRAMQDLFSDSGVQGPMQVAAGLVALGGLVQEQGVGSQRHKCQLFTVMADDDAPEMWSWDTDLETCLHSDTTKVGTTRRSVSLHAAMERMVIVRHRMTSDGARHTRTSINAWRIDSVDEDGKVRITAMPGYVPTTLPPPHGGASSASSAGLLVRGR